MRLPLTALLVTAAISVAAGVAIAGLPSDPPAGDLVIGAPPPSAPVPPTTSTQPATDSSTTTAAAAPTTAAPATTTTTTVADEPDTSEPAPTTTAAPPTTTTTTAPPASEDPDVAERATLDVGAANANGLGGVASAMAETMRGLGYETVQPVDAVDSSPVSLVFYQPGFELEAARLAADLGWGEEATAPQADMPPLDSDRTFQHVALIGTDRA